MVRILEGSVFFKSSIPEAEDWRIVFNHRDSNNAYTSQAMVVANGDQYSVNMDFNFLKVHYQVSDFFS